MDTDQAAFVHSPKKSTRQGAQQISMPRLTVHNILQTHFTYKLQIPIVTRFNRPKQRISLHIFPHYVFSKYEDKLRTAILCLVIKPLSICPDTLTH